MNYLAHIHLAHLSQTSLVGNFLGDFVKGSELSHLPRDIQHGIKLHRKIDSFTDHHPNIIDLRQRFPANLRRMSGVILDIFFDYLLIKHQHRLGDTTLTSMLDVFYAQLAQSELVISERFERVKRSLLTHNWLGDYESISGCVRAYRAIEKRLSGKVIFADAAQQYLLFDEKSIELKFLAFYPELVKFSQSYNHS